MSEEDFRLSVSKTKTFLDCKKKYQYSYVLKMPKKDRDYHVFGKFCHKVLEEFHQHYIDGCLLPYNVMMSDAFKVAWAEFKSQMTPEMKKECWELIDKYLRLMTKDKNNNLTNTVLSVEKRFELPIILPSGGNLILNGAIDRVQLDADNVLHVADYKTTKNKKYLKDDFFQLLTYSYVLLQDNPTLDKIRASYILLRHDFEYLTFEFTKDDILKIKDKYVAYAEEILSETEFPAKPTALCGYCDFLDFCPEGKEKAGQITPHLVYGEVSW